MNDQVIGRLLQVSCKHLVLPRREVHYVSNSNIDDAQKSLVLLLELLLIKDLHGEDALFVGAEIKALVPVWIQCSLDDGRGLGLLSAERRHCKGIWKSEYIPLVESIGSDDG